MISHLRTATLTILLAAQPTSAFALKASVTQCFAPCVVQFDASDEGSFHNADFSWSNGRSGPKNYAMYNSPGNKTMEVSVNGRKASTIKIAVKANNGPTYCVGGKASECPGKMADSLPNALDTVKSEGGTGRVLFRAGETFNVDKGYNIKDFAGPLLIDSYGEGSRPVLKTSKGISQFWTIQNSQNITIRGIHHQGPYDTLVGQTTWVDGVFTKEKTNSILIDDCGFDGIAIGVYWHGFGSGDNYAVTNSYFTNWANYGMFGIYLGSGVIAGNVIAQKERTYSGPGGKSGNSPRWADHGPIRQTFARDTLITDNVLESRNGWSTDGWGIQPAIRIPTASLKDNQPHSIHLTGNTFLGGFQVVALKVQNDDTRANAGEILFEHNTVRTLGGSARLMEVNFGNTTIRENIFEALFDGKTFGDVPDFGTMILLEKVEENEPKNVAGEINIDRNVLYSAVPYSVSPLKNQGLSNVYGDSNLLASTAKASFSKPVDVRGHSVGTKNDPATPVMKRAPTFEVRSPVEDRRTENYNRLVSDGQYNFPGGAGSGGGACAPSCGGKQCGGDGCGGSCGSCGDGQSCNQGTCQGGGNSGNSGSEKIKSGYGESCDHACQSQGLVCDDEPTRNSTYPGCAPGQGRQHRDGRCAVQVNWKCNLGQPDWSRYCHCK